MAKLGLLEFCRFSGVNRLIHRSQWRSRRLLVLCYHGISFEDEHEWRPRLFIPPSKFREHLALLRGQGANVLAFPEAVERLKTGDLPPRATAITFDDGFQNYADLAAPILAEFGFPATLYLTTYYVDNQYPIPNLAADYLVWKNRGRKAALGRDIGLREDFDLSQPGHAEAAMELLTRTMLRLDAGAKHELVRRVAERTGVDYEKWAAKRLFHLMEPATVRRVVADPAHDLQLHTHRHRTPRSKDAFVREIRDNRDRVEALSGKAASHFCYPSGDYDLMFLPWLRECGVETATTCLPGLAARGEDPLLMQRALDWDQVTATEIRAWQCGTDSFFRRTGGTDAVYAGPNGHRPPEARPR